MQHDIIDLDLGFQIRDAASYRHALLTSPLLTTNTQRYHQKANNDRIFMAEKNSLLTLYSKTLARVAAIQVQARGQDFVQEGANLARAQGSPYQKPKTPRIWPTIFW